MCVCVCVCEFVCMHPEEVGYGHVLKHFAQFWLDPFSPKTVSFNSGQLRTGSTHGSK